MKKRILFTIPNFDTAGSGKAMLKIAKGLDPLIFEAHIACLHNKGSFFKVVEASDIPIHLINYISPARPISTLFKSSWQVSRHFKKINPDLIHSYHYNSDYTEALASLMAGIPWVFTKKNMSWGASSTNSWKLRSLLARKIAVQNTDMIKEFYPNSKKTFYIPRGVDTSQFVNPPFNPAILSLMESSADDRIIICVANMVPVKGVEILIEAFKNLYKTFPEWKLWLVGDINNEYGKSLVQMVEAYKLKEKIKFSGKVNKVNEYLEHAEIFVLPTKNVGRKEGSPVALLEAMANRKVVLGAKVPGIKDQLKDYPNFLFEARKVEKLQEKLAPLLQNDTATNTQLGQIFEQLVEQKFRIELEVERHQSLYQSILKF